MRKFVITEEYGQYRVMNDDGTVDTHGATLESALSKAALDAPADYLLHAAELLEPMLGRKRDGGGQIDTGIVAT